MCLRLEGPLRFDIRELGSRLAKAWEPEAVRVEAVRVIRRDIDLDAWSAAWDAMASVTSVASQIGTEEIPDLLFRPERRSCCALWM